MDIEVWAKAPAVSTTDRAAMIAIERMVINNWAPETFRDKRCSRNSGRCLCRELKRIGETLRLLRSQAAQTRFPSGLSRGPTVNSTANGIQLWFDFGRTGGSGRFAACTIAAC